MENSKEHNLILGSLLVVLVLVGGLLWFRSHRTAKTEDKPEPSTSKNVEVTNNIKDGEAKSLPAGFPSIIPVEIPNITESYQAVYTSRGVTQSTVTYASTKSKDALWNIYTNFFSTSGYVLDKSATDKTKGQISGTNLKDSLSIVVTPQGKTTIVQINLLHR